MRKRHFIGLLAPIAPLLSACATPLLPMATTTAYPLCDRAGSPACGNIGQRGRPSPFITARLDRMTLAVDTPRTRDDNGAAIAVGAVVVGVGVPAIAAAVVTYVVTRDDPTVDPPPSMAPPTPTVAFTSTPAPSRPAKPLLVRPPVVERFDDTLHAVATDDEADCQCREDGGRPLRDAQGRPACGNVMSKR